MEIPFQYKESFLIILYNFIPFYCVDVVYLGGP